MRDALAATGHRPRNNKEIIPTEKTEEIQLRKQKRYYWENRRDTTGKTEMIKKKQRRHPDVVW